MWDAASSLLILNCGCAYDCAIIVWFLFSIWKRKIIGTLSEQDFFLSTKWGVRHVILILCSPRPAHPKCRHWLLIIDDRLYMDLRDDMMESSALCYHLCSKVGSSGFGAPRLLVYFSRHYMLTSPLQNHSLARTNMKNLTSASKS
jgi:hypothetical protein